MHDDLKIKVGHTKSEETRLGKYLDLTEDYN